MKICKKCLVEKELELFYKGRNECKECRKKIVKEHASKNKDLISENKKEYYLSNKEKIQDRKKISYINNREKNIDISRKYRQENKESINKHVKNRLKNDPLFKLKCNLRKRNGRIFKSIGIKKNTKTEQILGCSFVEFKIYLESKFEYWMSYDNHGRYNGEFNYGWDIDHIIPLSTAITEDDLIKLNHYTNLQPLCSKINRDIKKDIIT